MVDAATNRAVISIGLNTPGDAYSHGFQFLDLGTRVFDAPIPVHAQAAEQYVLDPVRALVFSASEDNSFTVLNTATEQPYVWTIPGNNYYDSSAEDCQTGIAIGSREDAETLSLTDLTQATYTGATWSAPYSDQMGAQDAFTVAQGSHLGFGFEEGGAYFTVVQLPATSGFGQPKIVDWVKSHIFTTGFRQLPWHRRVRQPVGRKGVRRHLRFRRRHARRHRSAGRAERGS